MSLPPRNSGFTLVELMVVIAIAAILLIVAVPSFQTVINSSRLTSAANELVAAVQVARNDAIRFNRRTEVCLSSTANTATPTCSAANATNAKGWIVFIDVNQNGDYNVGTDTLMRVATVHPAVTVLGSNSLTGRTRVVFRSDGLSRTVAGAIVEGTVAMCINTGKAENIRHVSIRAGSATVVRFTQAGACVMPPDLS